MQCCTGRCMLLQSCNLYPYLYVVLPPPPCVLLLASACGTLHHVYHGVLFGERLHGYGEASTSPFFPLVEEINTELQ